MYLRMVQVLFSKTAQLTPTEGCGGIELLNSTVDYLVCPACTAPRLIIGLRL